MIESRWGEPLPNRRRVPFGAPSQRVGNARIIAATAASQLEFLEALTKAPGIDWSRVEAFHLDEYIGLPVTHPGSFRKMLLEQLVQKTGIANYHLLDGDSANPLEVVQRLGKQLASWPVDVAFLGIGENGHIAFNDPPADFDTEEPYIIVKLDDACRQQQVQVSPSAIASAAMSSARSRLRTTSERASARAGARVKPQLPMTTLVTPCQQVGMPRSSQNTWASMCVCASTKPGATASPAHVDLLPTALVDLAHRDDSVTHDRHVAWSPWSSRSVDHESAADHEIELDKGTTHRFHSVALASARRTS